MEHQPKLLSLLSEDLGYRIRTSKRVLGYPVFYVDFSRWRLRFTSDTPVIWIRRSDLDSTDQQHLLEGLQDVKHELGWAHRIPIAIVEGDSEQFRSPLLRGTHSFVVIGTSEQEAILDSRRPTGVLLDLIATQIPISNLSPYEVSSPVTGSRFFGREYEVRKIIANLDTNYAVLGIRRIGKTSLLREVQRLLEERKNPPPIVYLDCSDLLTYEDYVREVVRKLHPRDLPRLHKQQYAFFFPNFLERMHRKYNNRIVFFLDEIDNLIIMQRGDWRLFRALRASSNKGACQYIIAGFRDAMREQHLLDSPLFNFTQEIRLTEFTIQEAHDLIVGPMKNLRIRFKNQNEVVTRIYRETAGQPNLIQFYCTTLLKRLEQAGEREIGPDSLIDVYGDEGFKNRLLTTFMVNTTNLEKAVVYSLLSDPQREASMAFTQADIDRALKSHDITLKQALLDEACRNLVLAGVFYNKGLDYYFVAPMFPSMLLRYYDVDYLFMKVQEEGYDLA